MRGMDRGVTGGSVDREYLGSPAEVAGRDPKSPQYCDACFSGEYPVAPSDMMAKGFALKAAE